MPGIYGKVNRPSRAMPSDSGRFAALAPCYNYNIPYFGIIRYRL